VWEGARLVAAGCQISGIGLAQHNQPLVPVVWYEEDYIDAMVREQPVEAIGPIG
jgi:hypothetical protein